MTWTFSAFADEASPAVDVQIDAIRDAGLSHIDLRTVDGVNIVDLPLDHARRVRAALDAAGIAVNMFGSPIGKLDIGDDLSVDLARLEHLAKLADVFDCRGVRVFSYYNQRGMAAAAYEKAVLDQLAKLCARAATLELKLYHENEHGIFGDRCDRVERLAEAASDGEPLRLIFDFDNYNRCGDDTWENWQRLRDRTDSFHLKDSTAPPDAQHVPIGQGAGKAREILADAAATGWSGPVSLEPHLIHSKVVMATNASGAQPQAFASMTPPEAFGFAAREARALLDELGIDYR